MKIAYFTDTYLPQINGVTNTLQRLGSYLEENNIKHMLFAPEYGAVKQELPRYSESSDGSYERFVKRFKSIRFPIYPECRISTPNYDNLCRAADHFRPDLVHLVTPLGIGLAGLKYARERNIPVVTSFHTNFDTYLKYYRLGYLEEYLWRYLQWFHSFSTVNFCPSHDTLEVLKKRKINNLKIWSRGIDTKQFRPLHPVNTKGRNFHRTGKVRFLYVGRLAPEKDLDILSESIKTISTKYPAKTEFILVGDGPMAKQLKDDLTANVKFTGYLRGQELSDAYASADVFVFPSSTETLGNVVLEAMASGLPVIAANAGGVTENVIHNVNGVLCNSRDSKSFTEGMERFLDDFDLVTEMGSSARQFALTKSWGKVFERLIADYETVLKPKIKVLHKTA